MSVPACKGYRAQVVLDAEAGMLVGRIAGINDVVGFHGHSAAGLRAAFERAVDHYIDACRMHGKLPETPRDGRVTVRVPSGLHADMAPAARDRPQRAGRGGIARDAAGREEHGRPVPMT